MRGDPKIPGSLAIAREKGVDLPLGIVCLQLGETKTMTDREKICHRGKGNPGRIEGEFGCSDKR